MILIGIFLGILGVICILSKRTLLGVLIGAQLLSLGTTSSFVLGGIGTQDVVRGHIFGIFIVMSGIAVLVVGYALAIRLFYLKKKAGMESLHNLRN